MGVGALPGSVHDKKAEWIWGVLAELEKAGLVTLATRNSAHPEKEQTPSSRTGASSASSAAAPGAPGNSPRLFTHCRSARLTPDEKGSLRLASLWNPAEP